MDQRDNLIDELARCIAAVARGDGSEALTLVQSAHDRIAGRVQAPLPGMAVADDPQGEVASARLAAVKRLFVLWQERCDHRTAKLTPERMRAIGARLRDGYTEAEVRKAIEGAAVAAFINDQGQKYDDLTLICRHGAKLEDFIARGVTATGPVSVDAPSSGSVEEKIAHLRREMAQMKRDGRTTEYDGAAGELQRLMSKRAS